MGKSDDKSIARSLGEFFGHIVRSVKADPSKQVVSKRTEREVRDTPAGKVILRRTTIEEIEIPARELGDAKTPSERPPYSEEPTSPPRGSGRDGTEGEGN
jgi:hypothetical protein